MSDPAQTVITVGRRCQTIGFGDHRCVRIAGHDEHHYFVEERGLGDPPLLPSPSEREELTPSPITNELVALVYRHGDTDDDVLVLSVEGHHADLEPFADTAVGGDWRECLVVHDDGPPMPPDGLGLWELRYPWREVDHVLDAEREDVSELCCIYGSPKWRHIYDASDLNFGYSKRSSPSSAAFMNDEAGQHVQAGLVQKLANAIADACSGYLTP